MSMWKETGLLGEGEVEDGEKIIMIDCVAHVCVFLELDKQIVSHNEEQSPSYGEMRLLSYFWGDFWADISAGWLVEVRRNWALFLELLNPTSLPIKGATLRLCGHMNTGGY